MQSLLINQQIPTPCYDCHPPPFVFTCPVPTPSFPTPSLHPFSTPAPVSPPFPVSHTFQFSI
uniref:Uncharacterized protein n=1 Tax=Octopus bimaculoides TaxID=37653 RepID=A0A0L8GG23_OCTBM